MQTRPPAMVPVPAPFAPLFSKRVWPHVRVLVVGAILTPGVRTVAAAFRVMGLGPTTRFQRDHRVRNRPGRPASAAS